MAKCDFDSILSECKDRIVDNLKAELSKDEYKNICDIDKYGNIWIKKRDKWEGVVNDVVKTCCDGIINNIESINKSNDSSYFFKYITAQNGQKYCYFSFDNIRDALRNSYEGNESPFVRYTPIPYGVHVDVPLTTSLRMLMDEYANIRSIMKMNVARYMRINNDVINDASNRYSKSEKENVLSTIRRYNNNIRTLDSKIESIRATLKEKDSDLNDEKVIKLMFDEVMDIANKVGIKYEDRGDNSTILCYFPDSEIDTSSINIDMIYKRLTSLKRVVDESVGNNKEYSFKVTRYAYDPDIKKSVEKSTANKSVSISEIDNLIQQIEDNMVLVEKEFILNWIKNEDTSVKVFKHTQMSKLESNDNKEINDEVERRIKEEGKTMPVDDKMKDEIRRNVIHEKYEEIFDDYMTRLLNRIDNYEDIADVNRIFLASSSNLFTTLIDDIKMDFRSMELGLLINSKNKIAPSCRSIQEKKTRRYLKTCRRTL